MPRKAVFLKTALSAYDHAEVPEDDRELTRVGRGTPGGEYLRRFWHPIAFSDDLAGLPLKVRILGEDLVLFRDGRGQVGLLELHCAHRGTSLEFGLVSPCGLRCCYHGWLYDVDGRILETPGEPADSTLKDRLFHGAYPTMEYKGLVFAYMGPSDRKPPFPLLDTFDLPGYRNFPARKTVWPCNWIQVKENITDPVHLAFLHTIVSGAQFTKAFAVVPEIQWVETPLGIATVSARRVDDYVWIRISDLILPNAHQFASTATKENEEKIGVRATTTMWAVPIDDTHTLNLSFVRIPEGVELPEAEYIELTDGIFQTGDRPYAERQRQPGDYEAMVSQRPIAVHALEHLATTDRGVIMFRRMLRDGIRAVRAGKDPKGLVRKVDGPVPTWSQETVLRIPPEATPEADRKLLREIGQKVLDGHYLKTTGPSEPKRSRPARRSSVSLRD